MSVTRSTLLAGPATATFNGHTYFAHEGIVVTPALDLDGVESDANGRLDATATVRPVSIRFTPSAPFADLVALYPHLDGSPGKSLFGATDSPLVITAANGARLTFAAVAITGMPDLRLGTSGPVSGAVTFVAKNGRTVSPGAANGLVTFDNGTIPLAPRGTPQMADDFVASWGGGSFDGMNGMNGIGVGFELETLPVVSDANALVDLTLVGLTVTARFVPATPGGPDESDLAAALQLQGLPTGRLLSTNAAPLEIAGEGLFLQLPLAQLTGGSLVFDARHGRMGELTFTAERAFLGTAAPLASLTEGAPLS